MGRVFFIFMLCWPFSIALADQSKVIELGFKDALVMAQKRHAQVIIADEHVQQALARVGQAASNLLPHLSATASGSRQTRDLRSQGIALPDDPHIGPFNSFDSRLRITQEIFNAGALERLTAASENRELSIAQQRKIEEDVLALVAMLYINARRAQEGLQMARAVLHMDFKHWQLVRQQLAQGTASQLDVDVAKSVYKQSEFNWRRAHSQQTQTRVDLCAALDLPPNASIQYSDDDFLASNNKFDAVKTSQNHPDIEVAKKQLRLNSAQKNAEQADWLPKISALADYGSSGESLDAASSTYTVGLQATFPIWEGGHRENRIREAQSRVRESEASLNDVQRQTQARVWTARETIKQSNATIQEAKAQLKVAETRLKLASHRLTMGSGTSLDVIDAKTDHARALDRIQEAMATYQLSQINLAHALGRMKDLISTTHHEEKL